ncbi:MAG: chemotaxis protein CheW [Dehalococcoidales bacterium]
MAEKTDTANEMQLVVFDLASEYYGVDIGDVREIIRMQTVTRVPGAPPYVEGIINLRGQVIPVVDLRKRLQLAVGEQTNESRIVWLTINDQDVGVIVDGVTEVLRIPVSSIEPPSSMVSSVDADYLRGIAKLDTRLIILLDLGKVLAMMDNQMLDNLKSVGKEKPELVSSVGG